MSRSNNMPNEPGGISRHRLTATQRGARGAGQRQREAANRALPAGSRLNDVTRPQPGFTLLEVLLATILAAAMLAGIWTLFRMYGELYETGFVKTEKAQLVRSLVQQLSDDLASTVTGSNESATQGVPAPYAASAAAGDAAAGAPAIGGAADRGFSDATGSATWTSPPCPIHGSVSYGGRVGLLGAPDRLRLDIVETEAAQPATLDAQDPLQQPQETSTPRRAAGIVTVVYSFQDPMTYDEPFASEPGLKRQVIRWGSSEKSQDGAPSKWHGRETVPQRVEAGLGDSATDATVPSGDSTMYLPEVSAIQFRYYDGHGWTTTWDSRMRKSLPLAVEVAVQLSVAGKTIDHGKAIPDTSAEIGMSVQEKPLAAAGVDLLADNNERPNQQEQTYRFLIHLAQTDKPKPPRAGFSFGSPADALPDAATTSSSFGAASHFSFGAPTRAAHGPGCTCEFPMGGGP